MKFLRGFLSDPIKTGSVIPSSRFLARCIVEGLDLGAAKTVLEYGPGTGTLTEAVLRELGPNTKFAAIELNPQFAEVFRNRFPGVTLYQDDVANVPSICEAAGIASVDCIVSGLPWAMFPESLQIRLLDATMRVLRPGGQFVTFTYLHSSAFLPGAKTFARILPRYFSVVGKSPLVWLNFPPAFTYRCQR